MRRTVLLHGLLHFARIQPVLATDQTGDNHGPAHLSRGGWPEKWEQRLYGHTTGIGTQHGGKRLLYCDSLKGFWDGLNKVFLKVR